MISTLNIAIIIIVVLIITIFFLLGKGTKKIYIEPSAEEKAKFEEEYRKKREALQAHLAEERKISTEKIREEEDELRLALKERKREYHNELEKEKEKGLKDLEEFLELHKKQIENKKHELNKILENVEIDTNEKVEYFKNLLKDWQNKQHAAVEANKREDEIKQKDNFYKIILNEDETEELIELNKAIKKLRNPMPFRKAVYEIYYKPKINDLVKRVVGVGRVTGIYKITHIETQKVYIGQSVDIGNRWKQHAKRGCGADMITQNKLYPAMIEEGLESFTWEIVEEVESDKLSEAEKYWQEYYKAKDFGYSMK